MKLKLIRGLVLFLSLCGICTAGGLVGKSAPDITIREWVTKNPPDIKDLSGKVYVVEFWAMWCQPCVKSIPHLVELTGKYSKDGLEFISLSQDKSVEKIRRFIRDKGITYHVAIDNGTVDWYGIRGYPTVVVVNHLGEVAWQGYPWDFGFEAAIVKALAACPAPLLSGVVLGPFERHRKSLCGGRDFAESYRQIKSQIDNRERPENSAAAKQIVETIDRRIQQKICEADSLRATNPRKAYDIYADILAKYEGIEAVKPAKLAYLELKKY